jgi:hypothetical protein
MGDIPPTVILTSSIPAVAYLKGEKLNEKGDMILTVTVIKTTNPIKGVFLYAQKQGEIPKVLTGFEGELTEDSNTYHFNYQYVIDSDIIFEASVSDGGENQEKSKKLEYSFVLPAFCGVFDSIDELSGKDITDETGFAISGNSFDYYYSANAQHIWMCCPVGREVKSILDEQGFPVTAAFEENKKTLKLTIADHEEDYTLYMFDVKLTGNNFKVTFNF